MPLRTFITISLTCHSELPFQVQRYVFKIFTGSETECLSLSREIKNKIFHFLLHFLHVEWPTLSHLYSRQLLRHVPADAAFLCNKAAVSRDMIKGTFYNEKFDPNFLETLQICLLVWIINYQMGRVAQSV